MGKSSKYLNRHTFFNHTFYFQKLYRCGLANSYMGGFKCKVTNSVSNTPLAAPKPPVWCEGAPNNCTKGAKQILAWHQQSGTNIEVTGFDLAGDHKSPAYNSKCGFANGEFVKVFFFVFVSLSFFCMFF